MHLLVHLSDEGNLASMYLIEHRRIKMHYLQCFGQVIMTTCCLLEKQKHEALQLIGTICSTLLIIMSKSGNLGNGNPKQNY